jgi:hypothetical protein
MNPLLERALAEVGRLPEAVQETIASLILDEIKAVNRDFFSADWLLTENNHGYGKVPIPQPRDGEITSQIKNWMGLSELARQESASHILDKQRFLFLAYSERMASLAVREDSEELLVLGLIALGLDGWRFDWCENLLVVSLHYDAAERIGANPETVFERAAALLSEKPADGLRSFLRRSARDRSLEAMGYIAHSDDQGFRYKRTW